MTNKFAEAFPVSNDENLGGLSKREYAAIHILAGMSKPHIDEEEAQRCYVEDAIALADKLMDEL
jgi:hypothetical protein